MAYQNRNFFITIFYLGDESKYLASATRPHLSSTYTDILSKFPKLEPETTLVDLVFAAPRKLNFWSSSLATFLFLAIWGKMTYAHIFYCLFFRKINHFYWYQVFISARNRMQKFSLEGHRVNFGNKPLNIWFLWGHLYIFSKILIIKRCKIWFYEGHVFPDIPYNKYVSAQYHYQDFKTNRN